MLNANLESALLIDEAYSLTEGSTEGGGKEGKDVITEIVNFLDKNMGLILVIVAGYEDKMDKYFFGPNEGMTRRFPYRFVFKNYTGEELAQILKQQLGGGATAWEEQCFRGLATLIENGRTSIPFKKYYDMLFSKQAGSMLNLMSLMQKYSAVFRKQLYKYDDLCVVLKGMLSQSGMKPEEIIQEDALGYYLSLRESGDLEL